MVVALHEYLLSNYYRQRGMNKGDIAILLEKSANHRYKQIEIFLSQIKPSFDGRFNIGIHNFGVTDYGYYNEEIKKLDFAFIVNLAAVNETIDVNSRGFDSLFFDNIVARQHGLENRDYFLNKNILAFGGNHAQNAIANAHFVIPPSIRLVDMPTSHVMHQPPPLHSYSQSTENSGSTSISSGNSRSPNKKSFMPFFLSRWPFCNNWGNLPVQVGPENQFQQPQISPIKKRRLLF